MGRRPDHRHRTLRDQHPRRATHPCHDPHSSPSAGELWRATPDQEQSRIGRPWRDHDEHRSHRADHHLAAAVAQNHHPGPRQRTLCPHHIRAGDRQESLLRRPPQPIATAQQRKRQRAAAPALPQGNQPAPQEPQKENPGRSLRQTTTITSTNRYCNDRLNLPRLREREGHALQRCPCASVHTAARRGADLSDPGHRARDHEARQAVPAGGTA